MIARYALAAVILGSYAIAADAPKAPAPKPGGTNDAELVERVVAARKEYQQSLVALYEHYAKSGDRERAKWAEDELKAYHLTWKPSYRLDILDVPPPSLEAKANVKEANELYKQAMQYKDQRVRHRLHPQPAAGGAAVPGGAAEAPELRQDRGRGVPARRPVRGAGVQAVRPRGGVLRAGVAVAQGERDRRAVAGGPALRPGVERARQGDRAVPPGDRAPTPTPRGSPRPPAAGTN